MPSPPRTDRIASKLWPDTDFHDFTVYDLIHAQGSPLMALLYAQLFWPDFIEFRTMVFLPWVLEDESDKGEVSHALADMGREELVERAFNFFEISSLFGSRKGETTEEEDYALAEYLASMWSAKLRSIARLADVIVEVVEPDDPSEVGIVVYRNRGIPSI